MRTVQKVLSVDLDSNILNFNFCSVNLDLTGMMVLDGFFKSTGVKISSKIFSSAAMEASLVMKGIKFLKLSCKIPNRKTEIFSFVSNSLIITENGVDFKEQSISTLVPEKTSLVTDRFNDSLKIISNIACNWSFIDRLIGLDLCIDYQLPYMTPNSSLFFFNGPKNVKLYVIKSDPTAITYVMEYEWNRTKVRTFISYQNSLTLFSFEDP